MDAAMEEEKKPFDTENNLDDDNQPDPNEELMLDAGHGRAWMVKVPKYLMERWSAVNEEDKHLATIRVYTDPTNPTKPRIVLFLPPNHNPKTGIESRHRIPNAPVFNEVTYFEANEPQVYELDMVNDTVENQIVVAERPMDPPPPSVTDYSQPPFNSRARKTILTGRIKHECNLRPGFNSKYRRQMRDRHLKYNTPQRQIMRIEQAGIEGGKGGINKLSSGVGIGAGNKFQDMVKSKPKPAKGTFERMARMPKNQLLDALFSLFREKSYWPIKVLREKTQQPEVYLKEVLSEVAILHRSGDHNGNWELKENFKGDGVKGEGTSELFKLEEDFKMGSPDDMDDDEDDDMEEVS